MLCLFAEIVLNSVLRPLVAIMNERSDSRILAPDSGDDGYGSFLHLMGYVDDASATIPWVDLASFFRKFNELAEPLGCFLNPHKTRILTSCNGQSIIADLKRQCPSLGREVEDTIAEFSVEKPVSAGAKPKPVELTSSFVLLLRGEGG